MRVGRNWSVLSSHDLIGPALILVRVKVDGPCHLLLTSNDRPIKGRKPERAGAYVLRCYLGPGDNVVELRGRRRQGETVSLTLIEITSTVGTMDVMRASLAMTHRAVY